MRRVVQDKLIELLVCALVTVWYVSVPLVTAWFEHSGKANRCLTLTQTFGSCRGMLPEHEWLLAGLIAVALFAHRLYELAGSGVTSAHLLCALQHCILFRLLFARLPH